MPAGCVRSGEFKPNLSCRNKGPGCKLKNDGSPNILNKNTQLTGS